MLACETYTRTTERSNVISGTNWEDGKTVCLYLYLYACDDDTRGGRVEEGREG